MKKIVKISLVFLLSTILLTGCGSNKAQNIVDNRNENKSEPKKEVKKIKIIDEESNTRPYAVMINNVSSVWPYQSGLNQAYLIYECLVEGGITRLMAVFKDVKPEKIQSIRSARYYYLDYALENDAVYIHWAGASRAMNDIKQLKINNINAGLYENSYTFRDNTVKAAWEHRGYITGENVWKLIDKLGYRKTTETKPLLKYSVDPINLDNIEGVQDANYVAIKFSGSHTTKFYYDETTKMYKKSQNKTDMIDYTSKERFTTKNIITYKAGYKTYDSKGRQEIDNIGSGEGYFISEGKAVPITWEKTSRSSQTVYKLKDGTELKVNDGRTYIEIQPKNMALTISSEVI